MTDPVGKAAPRPDMTLNKALARANQWRKMPMSGEATSIEELARHFGLDRGHVGLTLNLAFLSPTLTRAIVRGEQPPGLRLNRLLRDGVITLVGGGVWRRDSKVPKGGGPNSHRCK